MKYNPIEIAKLEFEKPDYERFPCLRLAEESIRKGGTAPAILNAANEVAVEAFLANKIRFPEITLVVAETVNRLPQKEIVDVATVLDADLAARMQAESVIEALIMKTCQRRGEKIDNPQIPPQGDPFSALTGKP